jgi:hypothetical protein
VGADTCNRRWKKESMLMTTKFKQANEQVNCKGKRECKREKRGRNNKQGAGCSSKGLVLYRV